MTHLEPICFGCLHFDINTSKCAAFSGDIPREILEGDNDHSKPLKNQKNDIVFEELKPLENTPLKKVGGPSKGIEPYKISTDSKDYRPKKKILKSAAKVGR